MSPGVYVYDTYSLALKCEEEQGSFTLNRAQVLWIEYLVAGWRRQRDDVRVAHFV
jgi:hypothetical protein